MIRIHKLQDLCYDSVKATGHYARAWSQIGITLEGRAGLYGDHIHLKCGSLPKNKNGYRVQFKTSSKESVPEGTPFKITWRATGIVDLTRLIFTPTRQYSGVVMQQGRVTIDDDWNEQEAISPSALSKIYSNESIPTDG